METIFDKILKSKKLHKCNFCGQVIEKSTKYQNQRNVVDGGIYTWKSHLYCNALATKLNMYEQAQEYSEEGVDKEFFIETVRLEYESLTNYSGRFSLLKWPEQLNYVLNNYSLK